MNNSVLYYHHLCRWGKDKLLEEPLYKGTSKSCEGFAADKVFRKMRDEGMFVMTHWQNADSTSSKEVEKYFGSGRTMLCGGYYSRAYFNKLKKVQSLKCFSPADISKYKRKFPSVGNVKCHCTVHRQGCGCINDAFISMSRHNLFHALVDAGKDPELKSCLQMLAHHARDEHEWSTGKCDFHPLVLCSCGNCNNGKVCCSGKKYTTFYRLTCPYHKLAYEIECH